MASFNRISIGGEGPKYRLFGSAVDNHMTTVRLKIQPGAIKHNLAQDWFSAASHVPPYIEVEFSAAQFAELLVSMNMGDGVPCTVRRIGNKAVEALPEDEELEVQRVQSSFTQDMKTLATDLRVFLREAEAILDGEGAIKKADRKTLKARMGSFVQAIEQNMPFVVTQFQEATEKIITASKAEVDAFMTNAIVRAGLESLRAKLPRGTVVEPPSLPPGGSDDEA